VLRYLRVEDMLGVAWLDLEDNNICGEPSWLCELSARSAERSRDEYSTGARAKLTCPNMDVQEEDILQ
jgi:hypothetical protein